MTDELYVDDVLAAEPPRANLAQLAEVLPGFVDTMSHIDDAAGALTCSEAEVIAAVMEAAGYEQHAEAFLIMHAIAGDDQADDLHHDLRHEHDPEQFGAAEDCPQGCAEHDPSDDIHDYRKEQ